MEQMNASARPRSTDRRAGFGVLLNFRQDRLSPRRVPSEISLDERRLAEAWSGIAAAVSGFYLGLTEDGDDCIVLSMKSDLPDAESDRRWLIWRSRRTFLLRRAGVTGAPVECRSMHDALQAAAPLSDTEQSRVLFTAKARRLSTGGVSGTTNFDLAA